MLHHHLPPHPHPHPSQAPIIFLPLSSPLSSSFLYLSGAASARGGGSDSSGPHGTSNYKTWTATRSARESAPDGDSYGRHFRIHGRRRRYRQPTSHHRTGGRAYRSVPPPPWHAAFPDRDWEPPRTIVVAFVCFFAWVSSPVLVANLCRAGVVAVNTDRGRGSTQVRRGRVDDVEDVRTETAKRGPFGAA